MWNGQSRTRSPYGWMKVNRTPRALLLPPLRGPPSSGRKALPPLSLAANTGEGGRPMVVPTVYGRKRKRISGKPEVRECQQICERSINLDLFHYQISDHHNKNLHYLPCQFRQTDCCLTLSNTYPYSNRNHFRDLCFNVEFTVIRCLGAGFCLH